MAAEKNEEDREISIMVATSGDTGKAALEGFKDVPGTSCTVFYPHEGVSDMQYKQMVTTEGNNTHVIGVKGNFDDCQTGVKQLFSNSEFHGKMNELGSTVTGQWVPVKTVLNTSTNTFDLYFNSQLLGTGLSTSAAGASMPLININITHNGGATLYLDNIKVTVNPDINTEAPQTGDPSNTMMSAVFALLSGMGLLGLLLARIRRKAYKRTSSSSLEA